MKKNLFKLITAIVLVCSIMTLSVCTYEINIRYVDENGNDLTINNSAVNTPYVPESTAPTEQTITTETQPTVAAQPEKTSAATTEKATEAATQAPATQAPTTQVPATQPSATQAPTPTSPKLDVNKKGDLVKAYSDKKIWAGILGECYIVLRNIDEGNEWGEKGKVYELHVSYVKTGKEYSMWADGYWKMNSDCTELTINPVNQNENGNIGCNAGESKTFKAQNGVFEIPVTFEQGGKTTVRIDLSKDVL